MSPREIVERRDYYRTKYGLTLKQSFALTESFMEQLDRCQSESARRLILGLTPSTRGWNRAIR